MTLNIPINCSPAGWDKLQRWRAEGKPGAVRDTVAVKVGTWAATEDWLRREAETVGDILQPSIEDGHRKLGYKILSGAVDRLSEGDYSVLHI